MMRSSACLPLQGYLKSLGKARTAEVKRDARVGEAEARAEGQIKEAIAEEQRMASVFINDTQVAKARRDFELKKAAYDVEVQTKKAEAEMAYDLQAAKTKQRIKEEQMQIKVGVVCVCRFGGTGHKVSVEWSSSLPRA